jgi:ubiquinone/menaquinone biosynthesis C-methylase UbiE
MLDWTSYATQYDLMADNNPWYDELLRHCVSVVTGWNLKEGDTLADFAAGTGNFSIAIARALPKVAVLHVELNEAMIRQAEAKAAKIGLSNWRVVPLDLGSDEWPLPELAGAVTIHALYAMSQPKEVVRRMCSRLRPGAYVYAADAARQLDVKDWVRALFVESVKKNGLFKTISLFCRSGVVRRENKKFSQAQRSGTIWTHQLSEFRHTFEEQNLKILFESDQFYRGVDDLIIAQKICE